MLTDEQWMEWERIVEGARAARVRGGPSMGQSEAVRALLYVDAELQRLEHVKELARLAVGELECRCTNGQRCLLHRLRDALAAVDAPNLD